MLSVFFYDIKDAYLDELKRLCVYPISSHSLKGYLINLSPKLAVNLLHLKNKK